MTNYLWPNLVTMFFDQANAKGDKPFVWQKVDDQYVSTSWSEAANQVVNLARALKKHGIEKGDRIVLVSENRSQWGIADMAIMAAGAITVPAYTTNTVNDHRHILNNSQAKAAIVSNQRLSETLLPATHGAAELEFVITMDGFELKQELSHPLHSWQEMVETGARLDDEIIQQASELSLDDTACIIYTSGTGGTPKGVMLAHRSILHNCQGATKLLKSIGLEDETFLSFLPLSHSYEHTAGLMWPIYLGAQIYYAERADTLAANMAECHPTLMTSVPRLYEMMRGKILRGLEKQSEKKQQIFMKAHDLGRAKYLGEPLGFLGSLQNMALKKLVRNKVREKFGGRLKAMVSGGGPLNPDVGIFFQALGIRILQGYGQTESGPVISVNAPHKIKMQSVGPALENTDLKIAPDGEILVRGDLVMKGYWRNPTATQETIIDGWLHTGDVGFIDEDSYLQITDRKKDIIVNSGGDNISPQRVEGFLCLQKEIAQSMIYGDQRPHLVGLIVPDEEFALEWASENDVAQDLSVIIENAAFKTLIAQAVARVNEELSNIEKVRKFILTDQAFSIENEQMTPTLKIRRHIIKAQYGDQLSQLYG
ncbi:AMP-dependent synthetase and ligase [Candidatus Terasakiella magnetica]|uniref:AMP-dependent synthetase and ligase n=1 Tax=Candidatus Terasakiella magnetica TaxID=1867952 RepID=A0A1C3RDM2_9PROT|nr:AMP-dependent synthetase/ligase [Candidatus Terasakiella magnetica]SCA55342.1 AMP-dependent synthetase and ligase [Candidatus Terasakiella magnetica]